MLQLSATDYAVIATFFAVNIAIGIYYARRGGKSLGEFFLSGRNVPWWLAGTSMVATTFAADTPLAVTGLVTKNGIAGNWLWWNMVMSGMLTVFFFAALWRRSGVLTDVEFIELRYSGRPAAALRGVRALYQGVIINTIIMGWVNLAIAKILQLTLGIPKWEAIGICLTLTGLYVAIGGLWSVLVTDVLQFVVKMTMAIVLAVAAVAAVGGMGVLKSKLIALDAAHHVAANGSILAFFPTGTGAWMPLTSFLVFIAVAWWASSYPGAEPGGGGYIAQRIFASKDEKNSILATLFFNVAHYALRPWPWIVVALCALVFYPHGVTGPGGVVDPELNYIQAMIDHLPASLRGLMMAGFLAAYMSTIGTQLNLGASYLTNDLYRRFFVREASEQHYVWISRLMTIIAMVLAAVVTLFMESISGAWAYILTFTAGVGLVMILRWYWWRINAWTEIAALVTSGVVASILQYPGWHLVPPGPTQTPIVLLITVAATTVAWLAVTFLTKPEPRETLERFYTRVRPNPAGWRPIAAQLAPAHIQNDSIGLGLLDWVAGVALVYCSLFGIGKVILGEVFVGIALLIVALACATFILWDLNRRNWEAVPFGTRRTAAAVTALVLFAVLLLSPGGSNAAGDKQLRNVKGSVGYQTPSGTHRSIAQSAALVLNDRDTAITGGDSLGQVVLPDSSRVTLGSNTRVQLAFFNQADIAKAQFVILGGKTRFKIEHPSGGKANYTFVTPTSTIGVRGTEGDIAVDENELRVNVYHLDDQNLPVVVTMQDGKVFTLRGGQGLVAQLVDGILQTQVSKLTSEAIGQFEELGVPTSVDELKERAIDELKSKLPSLPHFP